MSQGRTVVRSRIPDTNRIQLLEDDVDGLVAQLAALDRKIDDGLAALDKKIDDGFKAVDARQAKILWALIGLLISVCTTCIVLVITLGIGR